MMRGVRGMKMGGRMRMRTRGWRGRGEGADRGARRSEYVRVGPHNKIVLIQFGGGCSSEGMHGWTGVPNTTVRMQWVGTQIKTKRRRPIMWKEDGGGGG